MVHSKLGIQHGLKLSAMKTKVMFRGLTLTNDKMINFTKFKAFADDNLNLADMAKYVCHRVEKIMGNGENAGYQHFLHFL